MTEILRPNKIRAAILDWDGTVIDSVPYKLAQNYDLAHEFGNSITMEKVRREWNASQGFPDYMRRLTGTNDMAAIMEVVMRDYNNPAYAKREFAFAKTALNSLRMSGVNLGIITNVTREILTKDAESVNVDLTRDFSFTQAVDECGFKKPDARVFDNVLSHFNLNPEQILYAGDEIKDYEAADNAGTQFVGVTTGMTTAEEFSDLGITYVENLAGVADLLQHNNVHN